MPHEIITLEGIEHVASIAAAGAIVYSAWVGTSEIGKRKDEKLLERRIEHAEKITEMVFRASSVISNVRFPSIMKCKEEDAKSNLVKWNFSDSSEDMIRAMVLVNRIEKNEEVAQSVIGYTPTIDIFFVDIGAKLKSLVSLYYQLRISAKCAIFRMPHNDNIDKENFFWSLDGNDCIENELEDIKRDIQREIQATIGFIHHISK